MRFDVSVSAAARTVKVFAVIFSSTAGACAIVGLAALTHRTSDSGHPWNTWPAGAAVARLPAAANVFRSCASLLLAQPTRPRYNYLILAGTDRFAEKVLKMHARLRAWLHAQRFNTVARVKKRVPRSRLVPRVFSRRKRTKRDKALSRWLDYFERSRSI